MLNRIILISTLLILIVSCRSNKTLQDSTLGSRRICDSLEMFPNYLKIEQTIGKPTNLDSIYSHCELFLVEKLGKDVFCNFVQRPGKISVIDVGHGRSLEIKFLFELPQENPTHPPLNQCIYCTSFNFSYYISMSGDVVNPSHPQNVPDCNGTSDCGYKITKEKAIQIAKEKGFINIKEEYSIEPTSTSWSLTKLTNVGSDQTFIDMKTGIMSQVISSHRID